MGNEINKDIAQRLGNMLALSNELPKEDKDAILEAMAQIHCRHVGFATYECYSEITLGVCVDHCLVREINRLNDIEGVRTVGCCCGHGRKQGYVQVEEKWIEKMIELGYEPLPPEDGNDYLIFKPKTFLPTPDIMLAKHKSEVEKLKESIEYLEEENLKLRKRIEAYDDNH